MDHLTTQQASEVLGVTPQRVLALIHSGRLPAVKLGRDWLIAMQDLEMRGAGNILGVEQSGFIDQVGFDLYCRLLRSEIGRLTRERPDKEQGEPEV